MFTEWKSCALPTDWVSRWQALPHTVGRVWGACRGALWLCVISKYPIRHAGHLALNPWGQRILMQGCMTARRCANVLAWGFPGVIGRHVVGEAFPASPATPLFALVRLQSPLETIKVSTCKLAKFQLASFAGQDGDCQNGSPLGCHTTRKAGWFKAFAFVCRCILMQLSFFSFSGITWAIVTIRGITWAILYWPYLLENLARNGGWNTRWLILGALFFAYKLADAGKSNLWELEVCSLRCKDYDLIWSIKLKNINQVHPHLPSDKIGGLGVGYAPYPRIG